ncbi:MAG: DUF2798 domain-containing protein [Pseudomonadales bacterium]|nr:DUF2798 domain-containing protein [Pseudomonadales bacterium]NRA14800.1 DUF2798 domain-containing protein [Oceanospirillaceae bacterium]
MISKKYQSLVFPLFMSALMSAIMSLVISVFNVGLVADIFQIWLSAWGFSFAVAFPVILAITPLVGKMVALVITDK